MSLANSLTSTLFGDRLGADLLQSSLALSFDHDTSGLAQADAKTRMPMAAMLQPEIGDRPQSDPLTIQDFTDSLIQTAYNDLLDTLPVFSSSGAIASDITGGAAGITYTPSFETSTNTSTFNLFGRHQPTIGSLGADNFTVNSGVTRTVISGNGNIDFGRGYFDTIDLSNLLSSSVRFNMADQAGSGVAYNDGTGTRIFDAMTLSNGQQVLFEGIERLRFRDGTLDLFERPNDPSFKDQWNLHMMGVQNAWRFTKGSQNIAIGIGDNGLGYNSAGQTHPDLRQTGLFTVPSNAPDEFFRERPGNGYGPRQTSHGTAVQGIIAAQSNNGIGISGINWNSSVINLDVDIDHNRNDFSLAQTAQIMINHAATQGQRLIINLSLTSTSPIEEVIRQNSNTLFVIAAGNDGQDGEGLSSPAVLAQNYSNVMAVGASWGRTDSSGNTTSPGKRIPYSQYGAGLSLMGPSEVLSTAALNTNAGIQFSYEPKFDGTSAAAPNVTGVASLVWSANSNLSAGQVKQVLMQTAYRNISDYEPNKYGAGMVNADAAVRRAIAMA